MDPRLLWIVRPADNTPVEAPHAFTPGAHPNLGIFLSPTSAPVATHSEAPALRARPIPSRGSHSHVRTQNLSPRHKKRRAKVIETLTQQPFYHALPAADREYFHQVVKKLGNASYLASPQSLEPTVGSLDGRLLIGPRRSTGPGAAAARESVYTVLVDRPSEGAYVCWICGESRTDRRLIRALDHVRGHFNHRPYRCSETHFNQRTESASTLPLASVW